MYPVRLSCVRSGPEEPAPLLRDERERLAAQLAAGAARDGLPVEHVVLSSVRGTGPDGAGGLDVVVFVLADNGSQAAAVARAALQLAVAPGGCLAGWQLTPDLPVPRRHDENDPPGPRDKDRQ